MLSDEYLLKFPHPVSSPLTMCRKRKNFQFHCSRRPAAEDRNGGGA